MPGVLYSNLLMAIGSRKVAIIFVDGNNWYHNVKAVIDKPRIVNFKKLAGLISEHYNVDIREIRYYNSIPDIELGDEIYYKHMVFLAKLKKQGIVVYTRKLKKIKEDGKTIRVEKGIDVMISADMVSKALVENKCDICVLITGDSDFIPVMQLIKRAGKEVLTVSVMKGYARELLQGEFRFWILKKNDLIKCQESYNGK